MAAIDFPNSPTQGDTFTASDKTWIYLDGKWTLPSVDANGLVTSISSATSGQFLKWNGSAWVNDTIDLGADTAGSFVASLVAGTGVSVTNNSGEAATPTIALDATLDNLSNVTVPSPTANDVLQWNGTAWVNVAASTVGATNLNGLSDVVISTPEEFQTLEYDGTNWVNTYSSVVSYVRNAEATTLTTGTVVYLFGSTGDHATVKRADNNSDTTSSKTVGVVGANILASENGPVITRGYVDGINLSVGYTAGDVLWLGEGGAFTTTKPTAPKHLVFVGVVVRATSNGIIYVATQNGYELDELHDVSITSLASGQFLKYNGSLWVNDAIDLGTDTTGNYIATISGTANQISVTGSGSESAAVTIGLPSDVTISNDLTVTGNLTVNGTTTTLNTETLAVEDNIIVLNNNVTGAPSTNAGIEVERGSSTNVQLRWNETTDKWQFTNDGSTYTDLGAGGASISDTPPASPVPGQIWFESDTAKTFVYFDSQWIEIGALAAAGIVTMSDTAPASPADGKLWFNSSTAKTYVYYDSVWVEIGAGSNPAALNDIGDVTITSASSGQFLKWNGSAWVNDNVPVINNLNDIGDVTITSATSGQTLQWNGSAWVNAIGFLGDSKQSILGNQIFG